MALTKVGKEGITGISNASDATAITIDASENVGIGTTAPTAPLHVNSSSHPQVKFGGSSALYYWGLDREASAGDLTFVNANGGAETERMRIDASGNVDIGGVGVPSSVGNMTRIAPNGSIYAARDGSASLLLYRQGSDAGEIAQFHYNTTKVGDISVGTDATTFTTSSDYRLKENVDYNWDATTRLKQLKPARFNFISDDTNTLVDGFIAHEVSPIVPQAIVGAKDAVDGDGNPDYQGIDQSKLVPLLVKTIQELEARLTAGGL